MVLGVGWALAVAPAVCGGASTQGALDPSFGAAGIALAPLSAPSAGLGVGLAPDGKVLVGGVTANLQLAHDACCENGVVLRLTADGRLDPSFGQQGIAVFPGSGGVGAVFPTADGGVLAGVSGGIMRLDRSGAIDTAFGVQGHAVLPPPLALSDFTQTPDGAIIAIGQLYVSDPGREMLAIARLTAAGLPDAGFGPGGLVLLPQQYDIYDPARPIMTWLPPTGVAVDARGRILVAALGNQPYFTPPPSAVAPLRRTLLARLLPDGRLDRAFGTGGQELIDAAFQPHTLLWGSDGTILMAGRRCAGSACTTRVTRFAADGRPRTPIGGPACSPTCDDLQTMLALPDGGALLTGGETDSGAAGGLPFTRYDAHLHPTSSFTAQLPPGTIPSDPVLEPDGHLLLGGDRPLETGNPFGAVPEEMVVARLVGLRSHASIPTQHLRRRGSRLLVTVVCSRGYTCTGRATATEPGTRRVVARGALRIPPGHTVLITMALTRAGRRFLPRTSAITLTIALANGDNAPTRRLPLGN
jgi:uncharacterized delta-60 repeat protein